MNLYLLEQPLEGVNEKFLICTKSKKRAKKMAEKECLFSWVNSKIPIITTKLGKAPKGYKEKIIMRSDEMNE